MLYLLIKNNVNERDKVGLYKNNGHGRDKADLYKGRDWNIFYKKRSFILMYKMDGHGRYSKEKGRYCAVLYRILLTKRGNNRSICPRHFFTF